MHDSSFNLMLRLIDKYPPPVREDGQVRVLDVGARDVNGTYRGGRVMGNVRRDLEFPNATEVAWLGLDRQDGPNVDVVHDAATPFPMDVSEVQAVICGQTLEHCLRPWLVVANMATALAPGGRVYIIAPHKGPRHNHPIDCYRFFPEALEAIVRDAGLVALECGADPDDSFAVAELPTKDSNDGAIEGGGTSG